jgi:hypothetical protein
LPYFFSFNLAQFPIGAHSRQTTPTNASIVIEEKTMQEKREALLQAPLFEKL